MSINKILEHSYRLSDMASNRSNATAQKSAKKVIKGLSQNNRQDLVEILNDPLSASKRVADEKKTGYSHFVLDEVEGRLTGRIALKLRERNCFLKLSRAIGNRFTTPFGHKRISSQQVLRAMSDAKKDALLFPGNHAQQVEKLNALPITEEILRAFLEQSAQNLSKNAIENPSAWFLFSDRIKARVNYNDEITFMMSKIDKSLTHVVKSQKINPLELPVDVINKIIEHFPGDSNASVFRSLMKIHIMFYGKKNNRNSYMGIPLSTIACWINKNRVPIGALGFPLPTMKKLLNHVVNFNFNYSFFSEHYLDIISQLKTVKEISFNSTIEFDLLSHLKNPDKLEVLKFYDYNDSIHYYYKKLKSFTCLKTFYLYQKEESSCSYSFIKNWKELENLSILSHNLLHGSEFKMLASLKNLKKLSLRNRRIQDHHIAHLHPLRLEKLDLSQAHITGSCFENDEFKEFFKTLKSLNLSHTKVKNDVIEHLVSSQLATLELSYTDIGDEALILLKEIPLLKRLDISRTKCTLRGFRHLKNLKNLECLTFNMSQLNQVGAQHMAHIPNLKRLTMERTVIDPTAWAILGTLPHLEYLNVSITHIMDADLILLQQMPKLKTIVLKDCIHLSDAGIAGLKAAIPGLKVRS